jgi:hypothetical protein
MLTPGPEMHGQHVEYSLFVGVDIGCVQGGSGDMLNGDLVEEVDEEAEPPREDSVADCSTARSQEPMRELVNRIVPRLAPLHVQPGDDGDILIHLSDVRGAGSERHAARRVMERFR